MHCSWCGLDIKNQPKKRIWVDHMLRQTVSRGQGQFNPFCSESCKTKWLEAKWIEGCIVCMKTIKADAPGNLKIVKEGIEFYACPVHKDLEDKINENIESSLEDFKEHSILEVT